MRRFRMPALIALAAAFLAELLHQGGALNPVEQRLQDAWFQWRGARAEARQVLIVGVDEDTLAAYPDEPMVFWTDRLARAVVRLQAAGARVVGLDMLLSISPERWLGRLGGELQRAARDYDRPFREALNAGRLVMVATRSGSGERESDYLLPSPDYLLALPNFDIPGHIALGDLLDEGDGVIRRHLVGPVAATGVRLPDAGVPALSLPALLAVRAAGLDPAAGEWVLGGRKVGLRDTAIPIPYLGPPGTFPRLSLKDLAGEEPLTAAIRERVRDKVVLIGATAAGLNDEHFTPYATRVFSGRGPLMSGVEIHANVVESLLSGERLAPLGDRARPLLLLLLAGLAAAAFASLPAWQGGLAWLAGAPLLALAGFAAFGAGVLVPAAAGATAAGLALLGTLGWRLTGEERERARLRQLFGRYVSDQVVDALLRSGSRPELGGQSQTVTVLFSDIRNFTTLSERLDAKEVVEMLNTYFERACAPLLAEGGSIDKFIGDAVMVEFGSPLPVPDHALRAVRAALALRDVAAEFAGWMRQRFPDRDLPPFAVGIGLHSGEAVVGNIGSSSRMEFTAIGDTVNLASRIEGMTKQLACAILISEATLAAAGAGLVCGRSELVTVKGRAAPVRVFEVLGLETGDEHDA